MEVREIQQEVQVTQMEVQEVEVEVVATRQVPCMQFQAKVTGYLMSNIQIQCTAVLSLTAVHNSFNEQKASKHKSLLTDANSKVLFTIIITIVIWMIMVTAVLRV